MVENLCRWFGLCAVLFAYRPAGAQRADPSHVTSIVARSRPILKENSAAAMSARQPGVFFTINDSGNDPLLFALDTTGADRGVWRVVGAMNVDWESAAIGPCGMATDAGRVQRGTPACVYIGDTGDNQARHPTRQIYRVAEPAALAPGGNGSVRTERLSYKYADGPHDVEAMYVAPNGDILLITKRALEDSARRLRPALVFRLAPDAWAKRGTAVAMLVDSLPIVPGSALLRTITDASLAPDARHLAVRTYLEMYVFATDSLTGRVNHAVAPALCTIGILGEGQGEGVTWANAKGRFVFTSEGVAAPLFLADCPLPRR